MQFARFPLINLALPANRLVQRVWILLAIGTILSVAQGLPENHSTAAESELRFVDSENSLATVLQHGAHLEKQEKWAEALSHYESAIKRFPEPTKSDGCQK